MKTLCKLILLSFWLVCWQSASATSKPIGVVDIQKIMQTISFQKVNQQRVLGLASTSRNAIKELSTQIAAQQHQLTDSSAALSAAQKQNLEVDLKNKMLKMLTMQRKFKQEISHLSTQNNQEIKNDIDKTIGMVATKHDLDLVVTTMTLAYAANKIDLTDELIAEFSKKYGRNSMTLHQ